MKALMFILLIPQLLMAENWPCWRGPRLDGTSAEKDVPIHWSSSSNVLWKTALPGVGHASPIVWGDRLFTVTAVGDQEARVLLCLDSKNGKILWQKTVLVAPLEGKHKLNSHASSTPATDGKLIYVAFLDRQEMLVAAYDFAGSQKWLVRPGPFRSMHGFCSSPILFKDKLIVNGDHDGESYLMALDRANGETRWKTPRQNKTRSYCVPLIRDLAGRTQMVLSGDKSVASYDPNDGQLHWLIDGPTEQFVASPVYNEKADLLFITGGYPEHHILGLTPQGKIKWRTNRGVAYVPSPISVGDFFFVVSDSGVAHCFEAATGKILWAERLGEHHASLVAANGLVYFLNDDGEMNVVRAAREFTPVAKNSIGEKTLASPAISNGRLFLRSDQHVFCIGP